MAFFSKKKIYIKSFRFSNLSTNQECNLYSRLHYFSTKSSSKALNKKFTFGDLLEEIDRVDSKESNVKDNLNVNESYLQILGNV